MSAWKEIGNWARGLIGAFIQSASLCVTTMIVDPETFNIHEGIANVGWIALVSGTLGAALFLQRRPLPGWLGGK